MYNAKLGFVFFCEKTIQEERCIIERSTGLNSFNSNGGENVFK